MCCLFECKLIYTCFLSFVYICIAVRDPVYICIAVGDPVYICIAVRDPVIKRRGL